MRKLIILLLILLISSSIISCSKDSEVNNPEIIDEINKKENKKESDDNEDKTNKETIENKTDDLDDQEDDDSITTNSEEPAKLSVEIEATTEEITASLYHSPLGYKMIYDNERFTLYHDENNLDSYIAENPDPETYPDVHIRISTWPSPNSIIKEYDEEGNSITTITGDIADFIEDVEIGAYTARHYKITTGDDWDSIIQNFYFIQADDIHYLIETQYFLEAAEGYGARILAMLKTFEI